MHALNRSGRAHTAAIAALLALPWLLPLGAHYAHALFLGLYPTGFFSYDMAYYMALAREPFDAAHHGAFTPWYSNPFTYNYGAPRIYFQPLMFLFGVAAWVSRLDPGVLFAAGNIAGAIICAVVAIRLFDKLVDQGSRRARALTLVSFFWGGGLLCLTGLTVSLLRHGDGRELLAFDPFEGMWFLNFGRNLVYTTEAVYHALFFGAIVTALRRRFTAASLLTAAVSASHPFTGMQLIAILLAWALFERSFLRSEAVPRSFTVTLIGLAALHVAYYLVFLPADPEHRQLMQQWRYPWLLGGSFLPQYAREPWLLQARSFVPAYALVGALAAWRMRTIDRARHVLSDPAARLLVVWFFVSFGLANHEFAVNPVQPLHFTRGYIWTPLFLLGAPTLVALYDILLAWARRRRRPLAVAALTFLMVSDNVLWVADRTLAGALTAPHHSPAGASPRVFGFALTTDQWEVLRWMGSRENAGYVVLADDWQISYLATAYTSLRPWKSHFANTPWTDRREAEVTSFFTDGVEVDAWRHLPLLIVSRRPDFVLPALGGPGRSVSVAFRNAGFVAYRVRPAR